LIPSLFAHMDLLRLYDSSHILHDLAIKAIVARIFR
jgi:hypothetical protein